jgi:hypothetical protein
MGNPALGNLITHTPLWVDRWSSQHLELARTDSGHGHPMYLSEMVLILGWVIFYGSIAVLMASVAWFVFFNFYAMPNEERILEDHFGEAYRDYKEKVRRWL